MLATRRAWPLLVLLAEVVRGYRQEEFAEERAAADRAARRRPRRALCDGGPYGREVEFPIDPFSKHCLLEGVDELGYILKNEAAIAAKPDAWDRSTHGPDCVRQEVR